MHYLPCHNICTIIMLDINYYIRTSHLLLRYSDVIKEGTESDLIKMIPYSEFSIKDCFNYWLSYPHNMITYFQRGKIRASPRIAPGGISRWRVCNSFKFICVYLFMYHCMFMFDQRVRNPGSSQFFPIFYPVLAYHSSLVFAFCLMWLIFCFVENCWMIKKTWH